MDNKEDQHQDDNPLRDLSRREFVAFSLAAGLGTTSLSAAAAELTVTGTDVDIETPDGTCDAVFFYPVTGSHPGVLVWPDSNGLRPAFRLIGKRLAAEGYSVLVPNQLYRAARAPVFDASLDPVKNPADKEKYPPRHGPFLRTWRGRERRCCLCRLP